MVSYEHAQAWARLHDIPIPDPRLTPFYINHHFRNHKEWKAGCVPIDSPVDSSPVCLFPARVVVARNETGAFTENHAKVKEMRTRLFENPVDAQLEFIKEMQFITVFFPY